MMRKTRSLSLRPEWLQPLMATTSYIPAGAECASDDSELDDWEDNDEEDEEERV